MQHILILAGGSGTRLWPLSHQGEPKQLLELIDGVSLLRMAYERVAGLVPDANILVCTGSSYADTVAKLLPEVPAENILGEPVGRDSLNAVAWPAGIIADRDPDGFANELGQSFVDYGFAIVRDHGMSQDLINRLNGEITRALAAPEVRERLAQLGLEWRANTPGEFAAFLREEAQKWAQAVRDSGAKAE